MKKIVAIVGGGYVGKIAAWAALSAGCDVEILDKTSVSFPPRGFVFLNDSLGLPLEKHWVDVLSVGGTASDYSWKMYGYVVSNSFEKLEGQYCYSPEDLFNVLSFVLPSPKETLVQDLDDLKELSGKYDAVVNTLPLDLFIKRQFRFQIATVMVEKEATQKGHANLCVYNAAPNVPWTRAGTMFGRGFYEYPGYLEEFREGWQSVSVRKVLPFPEPLVLPEIDKVAFVGRYARWDKSLGSTAFYQTREFLR